MSARECCLRRAVWCLDAAASPSRSNSAAEQYAARGTGTPRSFALSQRTATVHDSSRSARRIVHLKLNCVVCFAHMSESIWQAALPRMPLYRQRPQLTLTKRPRISHNGWARYSHSTAISSRRSFLRNVASWAVAEFNAICCSSAVVQYGIPGYGTPRSKALSHRTSHSWNTSLSPRRVTHLKTSLLVAVASAC